MYDTDKAKALLHRARRFAGEGDLKRAASCYRRLVEMDPAPIFRLLLVHTLLDLEQHREALAEAKEALRLCRTRKWRDSVPADCIRARLSAGLRLIGRIHWACGRRVLAERYFRRSIEARPKMTTHLYLGTLLGQLGREDEEGEAYKEAVRLAPEFDEAHYNLGVWYKEHDKLSLAERHLRKALALDPKYVLALRDLGSLLCRRGGEKLVEAERLLRKAVRLDEGNSFLRLYLADILWCRGKVGPAGKQFRRATELDGSCDLAWSEYADFLAKEGDPAEAERLFKKAMALDRRNSYTPYWYGRLLLDRNRPREARKLLARAARLGHDKARRLLDTIGAAGHAERGCRQA